VILSFNSLVLPNRRPELSFCLKTKCRSALAIRLGINYKVDAKMVDRSSDCFDPGGPFREAGMVNRTVEYFD
jgi:hypothetical protein